MSGQYTIAGVQMDVALLEKEANLSRVAARLREAAAAGATLTVFPECALTGYCFDSLEEARPAAEPIPGRSTIHLASICRALKAFAVVGMLELAPEGIFNAAVLLGPEGVIGVYRKVHMPFLGIDRFASKGNQPFRVWDAAGMRVGMNICYDGAFPEASRVMALLGADLIVLPTNWPPAARCFADFTINTRAMENHVYYMSVNRVGAERGIDFIGSSRICHPTGETMVQAPRDEEAIIYANIEPAIARDKHLVRVPGIHEIDRFRDRRPEFYGSLVMPLDGGGGAPVGARAGEPRKRPNSPSQGRHNLQ